MQENEFEKQLKNLMDDLDVKPSDAVWEKVKRKLNDRNRKMIPFFFLLFAGLLVSGYFLYNNPAHRNKISQAVATDQNKDDNARIKTDSVKKSNDVIEQNKQAQPEKKFSVNNQKQSQQNFTTHKLKSKEKESAIKNENSVVKKNRVAPQNLLQQSNENDFKLQSQSPAQLQNENNNTIAINNNPAYKDSLSSKEVIANNKPSQNIPQNTTDSNNISKNFIQQDSIKIAQNIPDTLHRKKIKTSSSVNNKIPNWQWGITALYGKSNLIKSIADLNKSYTLSPSNLNNGDTISSNAISFNKKIYTSSEAYHVGGVLQKKIFKHGLVSVGLNYTHLSVKSGTAQQIDSALYLQYGNGNTLTVPSYYNPGRLLNYKSTYNFIELPISFQQDIFRKSKIALSYNAGISVRQLLNSRSLIYDNYSNVYYANNSLLRKTQFQFLAGLNLSFKTGSNSSIFIGPQLSYSLSSLTKTNSNDRFHFVTYGLQAGILLHKK